MREVGHLPEVEHHCLTLSVPAFLLGIPGSNMSLVNLCPCGILDFHGDCCSNYFTLLDSLTPRSFFFCSGIQRNIPPQSAGLLGFFQVNAEFMWWNKVSVM